MPIEKESEEKIFLAAQRVFQKKGFAGARMQEIADEAGINKSMLHYYYRSKDKLFFEVFQNAVKKIIPKLFTILASETGLREKVDEIVGFYHQAFTENPNLPAFIIYEVNKNPERFQDFMGELKIQLPPVFVEQVKAEVKSGRMMDIRPEQFLMNVVSMSLMPMIAKNIVQAIFNLDEKQYSDFLKERRKLIPDMIFEGVKK